MRGIDISLGTLIAGMGIGTLVTDSDNLYLSFILIGLGATSILTTSIKRKVKYKDVMNKYLRKELKIYNEKI